MPAHPLFFLKVASIVISSDIISQDISTLSPNNAVLLAPEFKKINYEMRSWNVKMQATNHAHRQPKIKLQK